MELTCEETTARWTAPERRVWPAARARRWKPSETDNQQNGNNDANWVKVLVNQNSREVFTDQPRIVPANRTAVPLP